MKLRRLPLCLSFLLLLVVDIGFVQARFDSVDATIPSPRDRRATTLAPAPHTDTKRAETLTGKEEHGTLLTPANFDAETNTNMGWWLVEHFSLWCKHCQAFYPTWFKLVASGHNII